MKLKRQENSLLIARKACGLARCFLPRQHHGIYQVIDNWLWKGCHYHCIPAGDMQIYLSRCDYHQDNLLLGEPVKCPQQLIIILYFKSAGDEGLGKTYYGNVCGAYMNRTPHLGVSDNSSVLPKSHFSSFWRKASNQRNSLKPLLKDKQHSSALESGLTHPNHLLAVC